MRFAYADPPYLGCCGLYEHHHPDGRCWDHLSTHEALIRRLNDEFPDGWALSCTSGSLRSLLPLCPHNARVAPWCKTFGTFKRGVRPAYMWEPVIFYGGRNPAFGHPHKPPEKGGKQNTPKDFALIWGGDLLAEPITLKKGLTGAKPERFCEWVLDLLGFRVEEDEMIDLFPGTGVMGRVVASLLTLPELPISEAA